MIFCGMVKSSKTIQRDAGGMPLCSFSLFDDTGEIAVKCLSKAYQKYGVLIDNEAALCITGKVFVDKRLLDDGTETDYGSYIAVESAYVLQPERTGAILITGETLADWAENYEAIQKYEETNGYELFFNDRSLRQLRKASFRVSDRILADGIPNLLVSKIAHM